jgi:[acyl-carrier-protein] S-malonyltransferase
MSAPRRAGARAAPGAETGALALLFPGQGAYRPGFVTELVGGWPVAAEQFRVIDRVAAASGAPGLTDVLCREPAPALEELAAGHPDVLQFALFGAAVALFEVVREEGLRPALLLGHSFGEIAALRCSGVFSTEAGARIVAARNRALRGAGVPAGRMLGLRAGASDVWAITAQAGPDLRIACHNSSRQKVISGPSAQIGTAAELASARGIEVTRLASPYAFHHPGLHAATGPFRRAIAGLRYDAPDLPVYSSVLGRAYAPADDFPRLLARHLVEPVRFDDAIRHARALGVTRFAECGPSAALAAFVRHEEPEAVATAVRHRPGRLREDVERLLTVVSAPRRT